MEVISGVPLTALNSFHVDALAYAYAPIRTKSDLEDAARVFSPGEVFILGGGSNILLREAPHRLVLHNLLRGFRIEATQEDHVIIAAGGGENWHELVCWTLDQGMGGLENLSLIPGSVGAAPIQNIGAYGVELSDVFVDLEAFDLVRNEWRIFSRSDCQFGYRDSFFKKEGKGRFFITEIRLRLTLRNHRLVTTYDALSDKLAEKGITDPTPRDISEVVQEIRRSKLPNPDQLGNAGSFFKNPIITRSFFSSLRKEFPDIAYHDVSPKYVKIPAAWLIERCGWKGRRVGPVGTYTHHALVIVHYGGGSGEDIWQFAQQIQHSVYERFGIALEPEVNVVS